MGFWWVNHKQTFRQEIEGGYVWSPKTDKDSSRNQAYINLTLTEVGDTIFSYADGNIRAVGRVVKKCQDYLRPNEFGEVGEQWDRHGWLVKVDWELVDFPVSPRTHISEIAPLLPDKYSPIRRNGKGNQKIYLAEINEAFGNLLLTLIRSENEDFGSSTVA
jgi:putative restriction endonuclease